MVFVKTPFRARARDTAGGGGLTHTHNKHFAEVSLLNGEIDKVNTRFSIIETFIETVILR